MNHLPSLLVLLCLGVSPLPIGRSTPGLERVPASQVKGDTLLAADSSFSVDAPSGWVWFRLPAADAATHALHSKLMSETFLVKNPADRTQGFILSVLRDGSGISPGPAFMEGVGSGLVRTSPGTGWHITEYAYEKATIPSSSAWRDHCIATSDAGVAKYRFGYVVGDTVKYNFQCSTVEANEPETFRRFVSSFRVLATQATQD